MRIMQSGLPAGAVASALISVLAGCGAGSGGSGAPPAAPTVTLQALSASFASGSTATLTWTSTGASACSASADWSGPLATSGTTSTGALPAASVFTLTCTGPGGSAVATTTVGVVAPTAWSHQDVGAVAAAGSYTPASGTLTVAGSGLDIWGTADAFQYVYQALDGDGSITAHVVSQSNTNAWAKAGVMFRQSLSAGSSDATVELTPGNGAVLQARTSTGASAVNT